MEILFVRELVTRLDAASPLGTPPVIMNLINPGLCASYLNRHVKPPLAGRIAIKILRTILERTAEIGGRMYVIAACGGAETHGEFMSDGQNQDVESWIYTEYGKKAQDKVFEQTMEVLEGRRPGLRKTVII